MKRALKTLFFFALFFGVIWIVVLGYWNSSNRAISAADIWMYLVALPLGAAVAIYFAHSFWQRRTASPPPSDAAPAPSAAEAPAPAERLPGSKIAILGSALICAAGNSVTELAERIKQGDDVVDLDPELRNADGFPIMTARVADLDTSEITASLPTDPARKPPREQTLRAVLLAERVVTDCLQGLASTTELSIRCLSADVWTSEEQTFAQQRIELALSRLKLKTDSLSWQSGVDASQTWRDIEQFALQRPHDESHPLLCLVATGSALSASAVDNLAAAGRLFSATNQHGSVPGEAAAALLLSSPEGALAQQIPTQSLLLVPVCEAVTQAQSRQRVDHSTLARLFNTVLGEASIAASDIVGVVCDGDHPAPRGAEIASAMTEATEHLDPVAQRASVNAYCGDSGAVAPLLALALGAFQSQELQQPVLTAMLSPEHLRGATLLMPAPAPVAAAEQAAASSSEKLS